MQNNNIFYVYSLSDPDTNVIFYIGKGCRYRDKSHLKESAWSDPKKSSNQFLYWKINSLKKQNKIPLINRIAENLTESEALELECSLIAKYGRRFGPERGILFNIENGTTGSTIRVYKPWTVERLVSHKKSCEMRRIFNLSKDELFEEYIIKNKKRADIARNYGVSDVLVKKRLNEFGITKPKSLAYPRRNTFTCHQCGILYDKPKSVKKSIYCSKECYDVTRKSR